MIVFIWFFGVVIFMDMIGLRIIGELLVVVKWSVLLVVCLNVMVELLIEWNVLLIKVIESLVKG